MSLFHNLSSARFLEREGDPETKQPNNIFFLITCLCIGDLIFSCQNVQKFFQRGNFFPQNWYVCVSKIPKFYAAFISEGIFRKKSALEKLDPANRFSGDLGLFPTEKVSVQRVPSDPLSVQLC
jgi:hypothetical protein